MRAVTRFAPVRTLEEDQVVCADRETGLRWLTQACLASVPRYGVSPPPQQRQQLAWLTEKWAELI